MVVKLELKIPGTDVGMSIAVGHLEEGKEAPGKQKSLKQTKSGTNIKVIKNELVESECECDDCLSKPKPDNTKAPAGNGNARNGSQDDQSSADMVTKMFTSLMQCTASNINSSQYARGAKPSQKNKGQKFKKSSSEFDYSDSDEDPLARGVLSKGCSSDFSVSQSLYPDDILVSYEPRKKKSSKPKNKSKAKTSLSDDLNSGGSPIHDPKDVRIIPINKSTNAKILPNRKFKEANKYDISCFSVPTFCNKAKLVNCCSARLIPQVPKPCLTKPRSQNKDEDLMISVPSAIYPDNILLTLKTHKHKGQKKK
ncbi:hypothetical protein HWI79_2032 [Cryptosporidium felis]|nr:hypothetical protein HWI79_2032 [Cryptosporidium felis]